MNAITFIIFGVISYWVYWSIKHEGIFWVPRTASSLGGFVIWIYLILKVSNQIDNNFLLIIFTAVSGVSIIGGGVFLSQKFDEIIEKRVGKTPYATKKTEYFGVTEDDLTEEELQKGREITEELEQRIRAKVKKEMDEKEKE